MRQGITSISVNADAVPLHLIQVVPGTGTEQAIHHLDDLADRHGAVGWDVARGDDLAPASPPSRCTARGSAAWPHTAATAASPCQALPSRAADAPVVVAVDGSAHDQRIAAVAADWAARLGRPLVIATVTGPAPGSFRPGQARQRLRGPDDPERYVEELAAALDGPDPPVETVVLYDPISVRSGLTRLLKRAAGLLVTGAHRRTRPLRAVLGSHGPHRPRHCTTRPGRAARRRTRQTQRLKTSPHNHPWRPRPCPVRSRPHARLSNAAPPGHGADRPVIVCRCERCGSGM